MYDHSVRPLLKGYHNKLVLQCGALYTKLLLKVVERSGMCCILYHMVVILLFIYINYWWWFRGKLCQWCHRIPFLHL